MSAPKPAPGPKLPPYGRSITLAEAKQAAAAALAPAVANGWAMVVAIVDPGGHLVYLEKLDETQVGSVVVAARARQIEVSASGSSAGDAEPARAEPGGSNVNFSKLNDNNARGVIKCIKGLKVL